MSQTNSQDEIPLVLHDRYLLFSTFILLAFGLLMVASTSIVISERQYGQPFHYFFHQLCYLLIGIGAGAVIFSNKNQLLETNWSGPFTRKYRITYPGFVASYWQAGQWQCALVKLRSLWFTGI